MIIAIASDGLDVSRHFGRCSSYGCYTVEDGAVVGFQNMPNLSRPCSEMAPLLREVDVDVLIAGNIGAAAKEAFDRAGIEVVTGASGSVRDALEAYLDGELDSDGEVCSVDCGA